MTNATRTALEQVSQLLHEAGWDNPATVAPPGLTEQSLQAMRHAYKHLLREDYLAIIRETLGKGQRVEDAARALGKEPAEAQALLAEALTRLVDFAEVAEEQGITAGSKSDTRTRLAGAGQ